MAIITPKRRGFSQSRNQKWFGYFAMVAHVHRRRDWRKSDESFWVWKLVSINFSRGSGGPREAVQKLCEFSRCCSSPEGNHEEVAVAPSSFNCEIKLFVYKQLGNQLFLSLAVTSFAFLSNENYFSKTCLWIFKQKVSDLADFLLSFFSIDKTSLCDFWIYTLWHLVRHRRI